MTAVIQRVLNACVTCAENTPQEIEKGFFILLGVFKGDKTSDADALALKISKLRVFSDENNKMNLALKDVEGSALVVSNFTLCADYSHGNRPSFFDAEEPVNAEELYLYFCRSLEELGINVKRGTFGADMQIRSTADGPVTIIMESSLLTGEKKCK